VGLEQRRQQKAKVEIEQQINQELHLALKNGMHRLSESHFDILDTRYREWYSTVELMLMSTQPTLTAALFRKNFDLLPSSALFIRKSAHCRSGMQAAVHMFRW